MLDRGRTHNQMAKTNIEEKCSFQMEIPESNKYLHDVIQLIDDDLIDEAIHAKRRGGLVKRIGAAAAIILLCLFLSIGVTAAVSTEFREWLMEQFGNLDVEVVKLELPEGIDGIEYKYFIRGRDTANPEFFTLENDKIVPVKMDSYIMADVQVSPDESYILYHSYRKSANHPGDDDNQDISSTEENLRNQNSIEAEENLNNQDAANEEENLNNQDASSAEESQENSGSKYIWYVVNKETGEVRELDFLSDTYLHIDDIEFISDTEISTYLMDEQGRCKPILYDYVKDEYRILADEMPGANFGYTQIYEIVNGRISEQNSDYAPKEDFANSSKEDSNYASKGDNGADPNYINELSQNNNNEKYYHFIDLYLDKIYSIPRRKGAKITACWASRSLVYVMEDTGNHKVYFIDLEKVVDFGTDTFTDLDVVEAIHEFGENRYVVTGYSGEERAAYLLKLPDIP